MNFGAAWVSPKHSELGNKLGQFKARKREGLWVMGRVLQTEVGKAGSSQLMQLLQARLGDLVFTLSTDRF